MHKARRAQLVDVYIVNLGIFLVSFCERRFSTESASCSTTLLALTPVHLDLALISRVSVGRTLEILGVWKFVVGAAGLVFSAFLQAGRNVTPTYFLKTYPASALSHSSSKASLPLAINSAVNSAAHMVVGNLADKVGRQDTLTISPRFVVFALSHDVLAGGHNALLLMMTAEVPGPPTKYSQGALYDRAKHLAARLCVACVRWSDARWRGYWQWKA
ncbi:uncharacterized protein PHACADRAFT_167942 [Phanerochaete carnosa HHB-10118-sp]|uniref:Uncharacterized protein n=1 Tax=Phanerochaete carnosa (strain HHB-10118-sp) TaxID=650164 RepID=K5XC95_PHACS|nr:uncharacterized protein PHACADRAFT_167942 [Phanerochaete carnosa HHB-10118-sp]EKM60612.1 hypothetical protein PHACADRAFT_167942 [Phanerochaete carnosa HHB-10118-sp]